MKILTKLPKYYFSNHYVVQFNDLKENKNLQTIVEQAYGPKGLGILFVDKIPNYRKIRRQTLPLFHKIANLPSQILHKYKRPEIFYRIGWSHGVQKIQGQYDVLKGSYFNNCLRDKPQPLSEGDKLKYTDQQIKILMAQNIWIDEIPQLQTNIKKMSKTIIQTGKLIAKQIDSLALKKVNNYKPNSLFRMLNQSPNYIGRMLHYFPYTISDSKDSLICGWHNDYGILTGLTSAMYLDKNGDETGIKLNKGDFTAKNRFGEPVHIIIPENMIAFQIGEATQVFTAGYLQATPHSVVRNQQISGKGISRNTFALFMGPPYLQPIIPPEGCNIEDVVGKQAYKVPRLKDRWVNGMLYKDLYKKNLEYYA